MVEADLKLKYMYKGNKIKKIIFKNVLQLTTNVQNLHKKNRAKNIETKVTKVN